MMLRNNQQSGFSLVETFVAITILLLVITGPMSISTRAAKSTSFSSEQVVAFFLAQEGAEIIQKGRDDILLENFSDKAAAWTKFIDSSGTGKFKHCFSVSGCGVELLSDSVGSIKAPVLCSGIQCALYLDSASNRARYTHASTGNTQTPYLRIINMESFGNREVKVTSKVYWRTGSQRNVQSVEVETYLFNIYGN